MTIAFRSAANDTSAVNGAGGDITLAAPTGVTLGDLRLHWLLQIGGSGSPAAGTRFTAIQGGTDPYLTAAWKVASANEGSVVHTTPGTESASLGRSVVLSGVDPTSPINTSAVGLTSSGTSSVTLPTVTTTVDGCRIIYFVSNSIGSAVSMGQTLHDTDWDFGGGDIFAIYYEDQATAGTTTARTVTFTGTAAVAYGIIAVAPDPGGFPTVTVAREGGTSLGTSNAVSLPAGATTGDLIIVIAGNDAPGTTNLSFAAGYSAGTQQTAGSNIIKGCMAARVLDGSGSDSLTVSGAAQDYDVHVWRIPAGEHGVTDAAAWLSGFTAGTSSTTGNADPPNLTGLASDDYLCGAVALVDMTTGNDITADPTNYRSLYSNKSANSTSSIGVASAYRRAAAITSEDPGAFANNTQEWVAFTFAVPPASTAVEPDAPTAVRPTGAFGYSEEVELDWVAPADDGGSSITGYKIETSTNDGTSWSTHTADTGSTATIATLTGLTAGTRYIFRVSAINAVGTGPATVSEWGCTPVTATAALTPPTATTQTTAPWHLDDIDGTSDDGDYDYRYTGAGVWVYVLDTGCRATHNEFAGITVTSGYSIAATAATNDVIGHGTQVCSVLCGATYGVAKGITLVPVKVFEDDHGSDPFPTESNFLDCLEWVEANHDFGDGPAIVSMSFAQGGTGTGPYTSCVTQIETMIDAGFAFVCSAGNEDGAYVDYDPFPSGETIRPGMLFIAASNDADGIWSSGGFGTTLDPRLDGFAPGETITFATNTSNSSTSSGSGTSQSAPIVAGALALWLEANPTLTPRQLQDMFRAYSAKDVITGTLLGTPNRLLRTLVDIPPYLQDVTPVGATVTVTPGTVTVTQVTPIDVTGPTVTVTPGTVTVTQTQPVAPTGPTVTVSAGTLSVATITPVALTGLTITVTAGTPTLDLAVALTGPTVTATPGALTIVPDQPITLTGPTVTVSAGTLTVDQGQPVTLTGPTVTVTPGTVSLDLALEVVGPTVAVTAGSLTVTQGISVVPDGPTITVTPGTLTFDLAVVVTGPTVTVTPGTVLVAVAQAITLTGPTITVTAGTPTLDREISLSGPTVAITVGTLTVNADQAVALAAAAISVTAGVLVITGGANTEPWLHGMRAIRGVAPNPIVGRTPAPVVGRTPAPITGGPS